MNQTGEKERHQDQRDSGSAPRENHDTSLQAWLTETFDVYDRVLERQRYQLKGEPVGRVRYAGQGIALVEGLPGVKASELIRFPGNVLGMAMNVEPQEIGVVLLNRSLTVNAGDEVHRTDRVLDVPVGKALLGRVVDALGRPLDTQGPLSTAQRRPIERQAPGIIERAPVTVPLQTGLKVVDALIPIGRGQRELILGDRQIGKTAIALDTIINQRGQDVRCFYCAIGQRRSAVAKVIDTLQRHRAMEHCTVVAATEDDPPGLQFAAPYAAMTMAEYFMEQGEDTLVVIDDLTHHARAYRELSLLLNRPPGREAFPGDIFYIHSRLLERSTHLRDEYGGGSLTALPVVETEAQNISAYIPTNLISITDGQIYLSPDLFQKGIMPAIDVGKSVSRVGGKAQLPAYRKVAGDLRLSYSQFVELEAFARFGTRLDEETQKTLDRGRRVREILKQTQYASLTVPEQIAVLVSVNGGAFDALELEQIVEAERLLREALGEDFSDVCEAIQQGEKLSDEYIDRLLEAARTAVNRLAKEGDGNDGSPEEKNTNR